MPKVISVIGLGKLGSPMAACFAVSGYTVIAVDVDKHKVDALNRGIPPVAEPTLAELIGGSEGRLTATQDVSEAVNHSDVTFIVVATPSEPGGEFSLKYVLSACEVIGRTLRSKDGFHLVVLTSTVMPGSTGGEVKAILERVSGKRCGWDFGLCYSPEFIALGTVIYDLFHPDFVLIGESDQLSGNMLKEIYENTCKNSPVMARMNFINAEITKLAVNSFITTKISYANTLARLCERLPEADVNVVTNALGLDSRIGPKYLKGAVSYGGPCFPRDNRAMAALAAQTGTSSDLADATDRFNRAQVKVLAALVKQNCPSGGRIGILGLAYKPNTEVTEESFGLLLAEELAASNIPVVVFDPCADAASALGPYPFVGSALSAEECIAQADVVVLATPWPEFHVIPVAQWCRFPPRTVIDCWRTLTHLEEVGGVRYVRLGLGAKSVGP